jgi:small subunit ribosomal protein S4
MKNTFDKATELRGATGEVLLELLEARLDNVVYRSGFAKSRSQARQLVNHGHISVNTRRTTIPSYTVKQNDTITVVESSRQSQYFKDALAWAKTQTRPASFTARIATDPKREQIETQVDTQLIVEHYSR